jgi:hypothetical protein
VDDRVPGPDQLMDARGALAIDRLWGLQIGTYFAAGPEDEMHGMFGMLTLAASAPPSM